MSNLVVLSTHYIGVATANGLCAKNISQALKEKGHFVNVVCYQNDKEKEENSSGYFYTINPNNTRSLNLIQIVAKRIIRSAQLLLGSTRFIYNDYVVAQYYQKLCLIHKEKNIDMIISMFFPIEAVQALFLFKQNNPNVKTVIYELDSIGDGIGNSKFQNLLGRIYLKWLNEIYSVLDYVFIMKSHEKYWLDTFGVKFKSKLKVVDIPVLVNKSQPNLFTDKISMIYAGLIERSYRSPQYLLMVLQALSEHVNFDFDFFSKGDCEQDIAKVAERLGCIKQHGYVSQEELDMAISKANYMISIGNSSSHSVPSKLITYFSYGKPIIHFSSQEDDVCKEYLLKYPLALIIDQSQPIEYSCDKIIKFIKNTKGKTIPFDEIRESLILNTPSYSAKCISEITQNL